MAKGEGMGVSEWHTAACDVVVPAPAKKSPVKVSALCSVVFAASINSKWPVVLLIN